MKAFKSWFVGLLMGGAAGAILVALFAPVSDEEARERMKTGYKEALEFAREAGIKRRTELEAELAEMQGRRNGGSSD
jgi:gas vesicle protein